MYPRNITQEILDALSDSPVVYVRGARQVGKSTLAKELLGDAFPAKYVTLDNASVLAAAESDPAGFIAGQPRPLVIDEVQRVPRLLLAIKEAVDTDRKPGQFLLTGSANLLALPLVSDSLAGRMEIITLWPLSEAEKRENKADFVACLFKGRCSGPGHEASGDLPGMAVTGGFPEAVKRVSRKRRGAWFESYLTSILERDIRDIARIRELGDMVRLVRLLATRTATQLNHAEISRTMQIPHATANRYIHILEKVFLAHFLPAWSPNLGKRLVKTPKTYLVDTGLAAHLMGVDEERFAGDPAVAGRLVETFAINEILKALTWSSITAKPYYYRTHAGQEIDLVLERPSGEVACVEIKHSVQVAAKHFRSLRSLRQDLGKRFKAGVVLYAGSEIIPFGDSLFAVPLAALWNDES